MVGAVSGMLASATAYEVPANQTLVILQMLTWDRQNLNGATFTISATGYSESVTADASGRAVKYVPSGVTYTVSLTHQGDYLNDDDQIFTASPEEVVWVDFDLDRPGIHVYTNLAASSWVADNTYPDYAYRCMVSIADVTASDVPEVMFGYTEAVSGNYSPIAVSTSGGVYLYAKVNTSITVDSITIFRTS